MLVLSSLFGCCLVWFRIYHSTYLIFKGLIWNLFLAWIPYLVSLSLKLSPRLRKIRWLSILLLIAWLLFFPNAPYLITDLFHLKQRPHIPLWYDLAMLISFAWTGAMLGFLSLADMQDVITHKTNRLTGWCFTIAALLLGSYGVYLGRFGRWNSWDVVTQPSLLFNTILNHVSDPLAHPRIMGIMIIYTAFMLLCYLTIRALMAESKV